MLSSQHDDSFPEKIMGSGYIEMTKDNIEAGDPMHVYKNHSSEEMFLYISINNLKVSFFTFIAGILFSMGSLLFIIYNGITVGTFQYFFFSYEDWVFKESVLTIWQHGTIEIICIIIAGAAGLALGRGLLFPGSYTRLQAFRLSAFQAMVLFIGIIPLIILAAFIESYITRHTGVPDFVRILSILLSLFFMIFYFVWLPYSKHRNNKLKQYAASKFIPGELIKITTKKIKTGGEIFIDSFQFVKNQYSKIFSNVFIVAGGFVAISLIFMEKDFFFSFIETGTDSVFETIFAAFPLMKNLIQYSDFPLLFVFVCCAWIYISYNTSLRLKKFLFETENPGEKYYPYSIEKKSIILTNITIPIVLMNLMVYNSHGFGWFVFLLLLPFIQLLIYIIVDEKRNILSALGRMFSITKNSQSRVWSIYIVFFLLATGYFVVIFSPLMGLLTEFILMNFNSNYYTLVKFFVEFVSFFIFVGFAISFVFVTTGMGFLYYSLVEKKEANELKSNISKIELKNAKS
ncbi:MAG: stage II sporulation protein M [Bacteroidales bacterium]|nr:stage II sporulation protein M [Bacteroidales bacterium]